jgi:CheY-like chemotaxis protein
VHPKLLLADDSVTIQRVIELTFADEEVTVVAVGDGQQAIDRVRSDRPDIVLADVGMPERDGYEVAAFIKGDPEFAHIPVLLLTGAFEPIDEARARAVGCDGVLVKPFEPQMVISRVRDLLAGNRVGAPTGSATHAVPATPAPATVPAASLEDYFDRLDAALASKTAAAPGIVPAPGPVSAPAAPRPPAPVAVPQSTHADLDLTGWNPATLPVQGPDPGPDPVDPSVPGPSPERAQPVVPLTLEKPAGVPAQAVPVPPIPLTALSPVSLDQAFAALLAAERGQAVTSSPRRVESLPEVVPDTVIDVVVGKVIERMGDEAMRAAVLDAAERLVREEIDRIKNAR